MIDKKWIAAEAGAAGEDERGSAWASDWRCTVASVISDLLG